MQSSRFFVVLLSVAALWSPLTASAQCVGGAPDGVLASTEACDDDNSSAGDGCSTMCMIEAGWACDRPVDFTGITIENYPGAAAVWSISPDGRTGVQTANTVHGTIGLVGAEGFDATYTYRLRVDDRGLDDDFVGFVIGYNSGDVSSASADFLLLDWKRRDQTAFGVFGAAGMALSRIQGIPSSNTELWTHNGAVTEFARGATLGSAGWALSMDYIFTIAYTPTLLTVTVENAATGVVTTEFSVTPAMAGYAGSFPAGQVGFYGFSQPGGTYEVTGPFGASSCNQPPDAADQRVVRAVGSGPVDVDVTRDFMDPNGDGADGGSVTVVTGPATGSAAGSAGGAPSGTVRVSPASPDAAGTQTLTYQICDDHPTVPQCDSATVTVVTVQCLVGGDCTSGFCDDSNVCVDCLVGSDCADGNDCTADLCAAGSCTNPSLAIGTLCSGGVCDGVAGGPMCVLCVDTAAGTRTDPGCLDATPLCDESGAGPVCVECLSDSDCAGEVCDPTSNTCAPCVDSMTGAGVDSGCEAAAPLCVTAGGSRTCVQCQDDATGGAMDLGCAEGSPVCDVSGSAPSCERCTHAVGASPDDGCGAPSPLCDASETPRLCVGCLADTDCESGEVCNPSGMCTPGCRMDSDCADTPATPVCDTGEQVCVECIEDAHCPGDEVCSPDRTCVACNTDAECGGALVCDPATDACVECVGDRECAEGLVCRSSMCTPECRADTDCADPSAPVCDAGVCVGCVRDEECPSDQRCVGRRCGFGCTEDSQCESAAAPQCDEAVGRCVECTADLECDSGVCDEPTSTCVPGCTSGADCSGVRANCDLAAGVCVECADDSACGAGLSCDEARGVCVECDSDDRCLAGETCSPAGACAACADSSACTAPSVCDADLLSCGPGCVADRDCDNPRLPICDSASTTCDECRTASECAGAEVCTAAGRCQPPCSTSADCGGEQVCNPDTGMCVDGCAADTDCPAAAPVCIDNMCAACRGDSDCGAGEVCDTTSHSCVAGCNMDSDCTDPSSPACNEGMCATCRPDMTSACAMAADGMACVVDGASVRCGCDSSADCAAGLVCNADTSTCGDPSTDGGVAGGALCAIRAGGSSPAPLIPLFACFAAVGLAIWRRRR